MTLRAAASSPSRRSKAARLPAVVPVIGRGEDRMPGLVEDGGAEIDQREHAARKERLQRRQVGGPAAIGDAAFIEPGAGRAERRKRGADALARENEERSAQDERDGEEADARAPFVADAEQAHQADGDEGLGHQVGAGRAAHLPECDYDQRKQREERRQIGRALAARRQKQRERAEYKPGVVCRRSAGTRRLSLAMAKTLWASDRNRATRTMRDRG